VKCDTGTFSKWSVASGRPPSTAPRDVVRMDGEPSRDRGSPASRQLPRPDCNIVVNAWDEWLSLLVAVAGSGHRQTIPKKFKGLSKPGT
jgi:hypothetical protein